MSAPRCVQSRTAPTEVNEDVLRVGYAADRQGNEDVLGRKAGEVVAPEDRLPIVTSWVGYDDWVNCPPSYDVWWRQYASYTRTMLLRFGVHPDILQDVMANIVCRYIEKDSLGVFTPNWGSRSKSGKSNFRNYYTQFLLTYSGSQKRNFARAQHKHMLILDSPVSDDGSSTWADVLLKTPPEPDGVTAEEFAVLIEGVRKQVNNDDLVDAVLELAGSGPSVRIVDLKATLGVNQRVASTGLKAIRAALTQLMDQDG